MNFFTSIVRYFMIFAFCPMNSSCSRGVSFSWHGSRELLNFFLLGGDQAIQDRILSLEEEVEYYKNALDEVQDRFQEADMLLIKDLKEENSKLGRDHRVLQYKYR